MKVLCTFFCFFSIFFSAIAQESIIVYFDFDQDKLNIKESTKLDEWMLNYSNSRITNINGYCDWKGSNQYNDILSFKRIQTVFDYLTKNKIAIDEAYIQKAFGENFSQDKNQALNRKVEIFYINRLQDEVKVIREITPSTSVELKKETLAEKLKVATKGDLIVLKHINFYNNSAKILPKSKAILQELLMVMLDNPKLKIEIQGHICCQPSNRMDHISTDRARAIHDYLVTNDINRNRLSYKGFGVTRPIHSIPENGPQQEEENRRVEIKIIEN